MRAVTRRQRDVLDFISGYIERHRYSPSYEEIGRGLGLRSLATVHKHICNLRTKGLVENTFNRGRSIALPSPADGVNAELLGALKYVLDVRSIQCTSHPAGDELCAKCRADRAIAKAEAQ